MEHWAKKIFRTNYPKTSSKHVWTLLGTILGIFVILKLFWFFFENFRLDTFGDDFWHFWNFENFLIFFANFQRLDPPWNTGQKIFQKITLKHLQNTFGHFWERFWAFLEFWKFLTVKIFVWTFLVTILGIFGILKLFWFFRNFSKTRPSMEHWAKNFLEKIILKQLQNTFGHFWERFWACLEFWNFFWFWKFSCGHFWGRFWAFLELWNFFDFFENFRRLDPPWNTGQKVFPKESP